MLVSKQRLVLCCGSLDCSDIRAHPPPPPWGTATLIIVLGGDKHPGPSCCGVRTVTVSPSYPCLPPCDDKVGSLLLICLGAELFNLQKQVLAHLSSNDLDPGAHIQVSGSALDIFHQSALPRPHQRTSPSRNCTNSYLLKYNLLCTD